MARELNTQPDMGEVEWITVYRWSGFGLRVLWQIAVSGHIATLRCGHDAKGPFVTFQRVQEKEVRSFVLRWAQDGNLREVSK